MQSFNNERIQDAYPALVSSHQLHILGNNRTIIVVLVDGHVINTFATNVPNDVVQQVSNKLKGMIVSDALLFLETLDLSEMRTFNLISNYERD